MEKELEELELVNKSIKSLNLPSGKIFSDLFDFINTSSKRIRSKLGILFLKSQEKELSDAAVSLLAASEIIHNASLLHDDVIDGAETRRNKTTLSHKYNSHIAILSGDFLVSCAVKKILSTNSDEVLNVFLDATKNMCISEKQQYQFRNKTLTIENYLDICKGKTAYLFASLLESLAIISNLDRQNAFKLGILFGTVFQIKNDLEIFSSQTDAKNGILTAKDIIGIEKTTILIDNYKKESLSIINDFPKNRYKYALEDLIKNL